LAGAGEANGECATNGRIINTVSESGLFGMVRQANYSAAKAGIASMTLVLAEMKKYGVDRGPVARRTRHDRTVGEREFTSGEGGEYAVGPGQRRAARVLLADEGGRQRAGVRHVGARASCPGGRSRTTRWTRRAAFTVADLIAQGRAVRAGRARARSRRWDSAYDHAVG
jgi:hypothetical protein